MNIPNKIVLISKMFLSPYSSKHCQILQKEAYNEVTEKFIRGGNRCKNSGSNMPYHDFRFLLFKNLTEI